MFKHLTDRTLKALKPAPKGTTYDEWDATLPGLGVRVSETGRKTFVLVARYPGNNDPKRRDPKSDPTRLYPTRRALGQYGELTLAEARDKARDWLRMIRRGVDPREDEERRRQAELRKRKNTFAAVAEDFITDKLPGERQGKAVERAIRGVFIPLWGGRPIAEVTRDDVRAVVKAVKDRGHPYQAHNLLGTARRLFSWAINQGSYGLESSPCDRLKPKAIIGQKLFRTRILNEDELQAFWRATARIEYPYGPLFRMLLLTGQRKSEVAESVWSEFDLDAKLWTIPAERMKADAAHVVPLSDDVITLLRSLPQFKSERAYLFSMSFGRTPVNGFSAAKARLDRLMAAELRSDLKPFVTHDLRRTMRTGLSALPVVDLVRELVIGHTKPGLHKVYDQFSYLNEKRHALDLWAVRLRNIIEPAPANVVPMLRA